MEKSRYDQDEVFPLDIQRNREAMLYHGEETEPEVPVAGRRSVSADRSRAMEIPDKDVDVSTAQNVEGVLPAGVNQSVPIRTVTSSPGGLAMIGELGQVEMEFNDVSVVDTFLSDKGAAYTIVEKRQQGRIGRGGKKTDQSTTHEVLSVEVERLIRWVLKRLVLLD
ncbi:hypothetical protein NE237_007554 [Protea cynaroides]|uniref:Uncharacterized protein n=1 Tax=Protea cynaroides TaxID=273540 RepID=A0A9Q0QW83_9MAGN|nr:hypothetical protein NE237_007554 [Protea cynaroides]